MSEARKYYTVLDRRWKQEQAIGSRVPDSHRDIALKALQAGDTKTLTRLGRASNDRRTWREFEMQYAPVVEAITNRFRRATSPNIRAMYGQPDLTAKEYGATYCEALRTIARQVDEPLYADWLTVQYTAQAHPWMVAYLRDLWHQQRTETPTDHLTLDLDALSIGTLFALCRAAEERLAAVT
jgi:hypothetical protein